jgi:predicted acyltransferase (DUF342 family)
MARAFATPTRCKTSTSKTASSRVLRWIDAEGDIDVGADSDLGLSASGGARVRLGERVRFERVWGSPVMSVTRAAAPFVLDRHARTVVDAKLVAAGESVVLHGPARVARRTYVPMDLKVHGSLAIEAGVHVGGNVIARGDVTVASDVSLGGNIFAEGDIRLGPGTRVGRAGAAKTVYATGQVLVADNVEVFGWIVSEKGGQTL